MPRATLRIESSHTTLILESILPEVGREIPRTKVSASAEGETFLLRVEAADLPALRAALNSYLRWIRIAEEVVEFTGG